MSVGLDDMVERILDRVDELDKAWDKNLDEYMAGMPYGMGQARDEEFAFLFEERINGRLMRDSKTGQVVIDPMTGQPQYEIPPDQDFVRALLATRNGKAMVEGGADLVKRYERIRGLSGVPV